MNNTNYNIDFSTVPNIHDKISEKEIQNLNAIFQNPEVIEKLKEIEVFRKKRQKAYGYVTIAMVIITLLVSYFIGKIAAAATVGFFAIIMVGLFFYVGTGDNSFSTIEGITGLGALLYGGVFLKYKSKIEIPLKRDIMSRVCKNLHSTFKYSYGAEYSFDDLNILLQKKFLKSYNRLEKVEDSVELKMEKDGKGFLLNGFELKTRRVSGSGKRRKNVVTNHEYLMKIVFPHARIPMESDLMLVPDIHETGSIIGRPFRWLTKGLRKKRIILEDVEFEKIFDVNCEDEVTSRMILTPAFMDKLVTFVKKTGNTYSFLFTDNTVYIKRKINKKYMEVGTKKNMFENVSGFLEFYLDMREVLILSQDLHFMYLSKTTDAVLNDEKIESAPIIFDNNKAGVFGLFGKKKQKLHQNIAVS